MSGNEQVAETPLLKRLNEQRVAAARMAREFADRAAEGTELSAEDNQAYTRANKDIDRYGSMIQDEIKRIQEDRSIEDAYSQGLRKLRGAPGSQESRAAQNGRTLAEQMREDLRASRRGESRNGGMYQSLPEHRDLLSLTGGGASTVPTTLVENLYQKLFDDSSVLQAGVTMLRTESGEPMKLPRLTALGNLSSAAVYTPVGNPPANSTNAPRIPEAGTIAEGDPNFDQVTLDAYKYAQFTQVSRELVEDGVLDIEALIGQVLGRNVANYVGYDLTLGTGTAQPRGVRTLVPAGNKVDTAAGGLFPTTDFDKFFDVIAKLKPGYRRNAKWMINDQAVFALRKLRMNNVYAWEPNLQGAGQPDRFLGYPVLSDPNMPVPAASAGVTAIFGDFSAYFVRMVRDVRIEWSMEYAWVNDLLSVKAVVRADGDAIDDTAFAGINSIA